jgi:hypothetical protein
MNKDSYIVFQNETELRVTLMAQTTLVFNPFYAFTNIANNEDLFHTKNNILFTKIHNCVQCYIRKYTFNSI